MSISPTFVAVVPTVTAAAVLDVVTVVPTVTAAAVLVVSLAVVAVRVVRRRMALGTAVDGGQATTEYALILLAAALVALLVVAWATAGGGAARVGQLFDRVIDGVIDRV